MQCGRLLFDSWVGKTPWRRERLPTPVFWSGGFHELCGSRVRKESDTTEQHSLHFSDPTNFPNQGLNPGFPHCRQILYQLSHKGSPRILRVGSPSLLQQIFPTQELNQGLLHCRWILYQLSYQGSPKNREGNEWQPTLSILV